MNPKAWARRLLKAADSGTDREIAQIEARAGVSLSSAVDAAWEDAVLDGDADLARKLGAAFDRLTGRTP